MTVVKSVISIVPGLMATSLMVKSIPKKKPTTKSIVKDFTGIMIGVPLIKPVANVAGSF